MKVFIKNLDVFMEVKNKGIELDISDINGGHIGDLVVTKAKLIWCQGKKGRNNGKEITWEKFIEYMSKQ